MASQPILNQSLAVFDGKELRNVVDDQIEAALKDPRRSEEAGPGGDLPLERLGLCWHEESWISSDLAQR